jgi:peptidoglycan LD-endopeptidase LytH
MILTLALAMAVSAAAPVVADTEGDLENAKAALAAKQADLNLAAAALNQAEADLAQTQDQIAATRESIERLQGRIGAIRERLARRAVEAYKSGAGGAIEMLLTSTSFGEFSDRLEFLGSIAESDTSLVVEVEVSEEELQRKRGDLAVLAERQSAEAVRLEAQRGAAASRVEDLARAVDELTAELKKEEAAERALVLLGQSPQPGGAAGGILERCPVAGPNSFVDSFGWPRSGGRTHQGIDLIAPLGTPVVAAHAGAVSHSSSSLGGIQAYVRAGNGDYTFYAHLSSYSGAGGSVSAGTVIGYVGSTGNAGSTNHLHFEYHPGGGSAVNPYQMLLSVC